MKKTLTILALLAIVTTVSAREMGRKELPKPACATVPDGGSTAALMLGSLAVIGVLRRKLL